MENQDQDQEHSQVQEYINQLSPKEKKAYEIAKSHLQTSFDLEQSIGFKKFMAKKQSNASS